MSYRMRKYILDRQFDLKIVDVVLSVEFPQIDPAICKKILNQITQFYHNNPFSFIKPASLAAYTMDWQREQKKLDLTRKHIARAFEVSDRQISQNRRHFLKRLGLQ